MPRPSAVRRSRAFAAANSGVDSRHIDEIGDNGVTGNRATSTARSGCPCMPSVVVLSRAVPHRRARRHFVPAANSTRSPKFWRSVSARLTVRLTTTIRSHATREQTVDHRPCRAAGAEHHRLVRGPDPSAGRSHRDCPGTPQRRCWSSAARRRRATAYWRRRSHAPVRRAATARTPLPYAAPSRWRRHNRALRAIARTPQILPPAPVRAGIRRLFRIAWSQ